MTHTRAEAKAYNDKLKIDMSIEDKLELLFDDLRAYTINNLGTKKYDAIKKVFNTFKEDEKDANIEIILRELKRIKNGEPAGMFVNAFSIEALKEAVEIVLNADDMEALLDKIKLKLYVMGDGDLDEKEVLEAVLNDNFHKDYERQILSIITRFVGKKYYNYFYRDLEYHLNKIIDNRTYWCESLEPKVADLRARKEEERKTNETR